MKISAVALILFFIWIGGSAQTLSFEKQALVLVKRMPASRLDKGLPERPFADWFKELAGPDAGILWQLSECGERPGSERGELMACTEANAILANGSKVVIAVSVGTFKKGLSGAPAFYRAVLERDNQLYQVRHLRSLPEMLRLSQNLRFVTPEMSPDMIFPELSGSQKLSSNLPQVPLPFYLDYLRRYSLGIDFTPDILAAVEDRPNLVIPERSLRKVAEGVIRGMATKKVRPVYPRVALNYSNAHGAVEVQIVVSEQGKVIEATAISGHPMLHSAALDAARKWAFKPTTINGSRVKVQSSLTLLFDPVNQ
jgi:TonB family protein